MDGRRSFPFGAFRPIFRGKLTVSFREGILYCMYCMYGRFLEYIIFQPSSKLLLNIQFPRYKRPLFGETSCWHHDDSPTFYLRDYYDIILTGLQPCCGKCWSFPVQNWDLRNNHSNWTSSSPLRAKERFLQDSSFSVHHGTNNSLYIVGSNHLVRGWLGCTITSSEKYLCSITILRRWLDPQGIE